jgi:hypothetical protein
VSYHEQSVIDRSDAASSVPVATDRSPTDAQLVPLTGEDRRQAERAARASLRAQISRLEHELSGIVAGRFPFIAAPVTPIVAASGPSLLDLGELERSRDRLAARVQDMRGRVDERVEQERRAREQLKRMELEPGRYKFVRLPVSDLGQGGCGVWEVRPRLGLIGMLAGWWQLTLSSGCPLPKGSCSTRDPDTPR